MDTNTDKSLITIMDKSFKENTLNNKYELFFTFFVYPRDSMPFVYKCRHVIDFMRYRKANQSHLNPCIIYATRNRKYTRPELWVYGLDYQYEFWCDFDKYYSNHRYYYKVYLKENEGIRGPRDVVPLLTLNLRSLPKRWIKELDPYCI